MIEEQLEQGEIGTGQNHLFTVTVKQAVTDRIQAPVIEGQYIAAIALLAETGAAQQSFDSCLQLTRTEGFTQVIIGAQLQADDPVGFIRAGREHDDRHLGQAWMLAHPAAQAETVFIGQHHIEDHQVAVTVVQGLAKALAVGNRLHAETRAAQVGLQQFADVLVIVDQQYRLAHGTLPCSVEAGNQPACCKATPAPSKPENSAVTSHTGTFLK
ncbi:hypothetical protein D3C76_1075490 [compost metagenome]